MKSIYLNSEGFEIREEEIPVCGDNEIVIKTKICGICEGDLFTWRNRNSIKAPLLLGHEGSGKVYETGKNIKEFAPGDFVTVLGGAYSEFFKTTPDNLIKIPCGVPAEEVLGEPIACFVHASLRFGILPGDKVAVVGCGYMGLGAMQMAKILGAGEIIVLEPIKWRREKSLEFGADNTYDPSGKDPVEILKDLGEFDVVIEATGVSQALPICTILVKEHGKIILIGYHQSEKGMRTIDMKTWNYKAIDVINGHVRRNYEKLEAMRRGVSLLSTGKLIHSDLLKYYHFEEVEKAFNDLNSRKENLYKAVLVF